MYYTLHKLKKKGIFGGGNVCICRVYVVQFKGYFKLIMRLFKARLAYKGV